MDMMDDGLDHESWDCFHLGSFLWLPLDCRVSGLKLYCTLQQYVFVPESGAIDRPAMQMKVAEDIDIYTFLAFVYYCIFLNSQSTHI